jgi:hypothetical protein
MNSPWNCLYDRVKDRNYGVLFFWTLMALIGLLILFGALLQISFQESVARALPVLVVFALGWMGVAVRRAWSRRNERENLSRLSSDEVAKARSKLLKNRTRPNL